MIEPGGNVLAASVPMTGPAPPVQRHSAIGVSHQVEGRPGKPLPKRLAQIFAVLLRPGDLLLQLCQSSPDLMNAVCRHNR